MLNARSWFALALAAACMAVATTTSAQSPEYVVFKLLDDSCAVAVGDEISSSEADVEPVNDELVIYEAQDVLPLIDMDVQDLADLREEAAELSGQYAVDMSQYFWVQVDAEDADDLVSALLLLELIEDAYVMPAMEEPPCDPDNDTPSYVSTQAYRLDAPVGVGANSAIPQSHGANRGGGVTVADVEYCWDRAHEDLCGGVAAPSPVPAAAAVTAARLDHGEAVLGVLWADEDDSGVTGLATEATMLVVTVYPDGARRANIPNALLQAAAQLVAGDVLLIEQQVSSRCAGYGFMPVEIFSGSYNAIRQAAQRGIHVVEAAANSSEDLDAYYSEANCTSGDHHFDLDHTLVQDPLGNWVPNRDSFAIIVGASVPTVPHGRMYSSYGLRVDAYSHGTSVDTLGSYNGTCHDHGANDDFTCSFSGSSSGSAIVAGCVAVLSAAHADLDGEPYLPGALRLLLRTTGTLPDTAADDLIGRQPDLVDQLDIVAMGPQPANVFTGHDSDPQDDETPGPFGTVACGIGDQDDDGVRDILVGAPSQETSTLTDAGAVYLYSGLTGALIRKHFGEASNAQFGSSIAVGDVDDDGTEDYAVGAPGHKRVYVFDGGSNGTEMFEIVESGITSFGSTVAVGDLNDDDGNDDIAVGSPIRNITSNGGGNVRVYSGADGSTLLFEEDTVSPAGPDRLGDSLAIGDITGDGEPDLIAGAPGFSTNRGRIRARSSDTFDILTLNALEGASAGDQFGRGLAVVDMDGDGVDEVAVGAPGSDAAGTNFGQVKVYEGNSVNATRTINGSESGADFGQELANAGRIDGDSGAGGPKEDLIIASPAVGEVRVFTLASDSTPARLYVSQDGGAHLGTTVAGNGGGRVLAGDPDAVSARGRVYEFWATLP